MGRKKTGYNNDDYIKQHIKRYTLSLNNNTDREMITHLNRKKQYSKYIKELIQKDMNKEE